MKALPLPQVVQEARQFTLWEDFLDYTSGGKFTTVVSDLGTVAVSDAAGGIVVMSPSDSSVGDNDEAYVKSTKEVFLFAASKPLAGEGRIQFSEANTDDANVAFGFADAVGANTIVDDGAGIKTSFSGAVIYKVDGSNVWKFVTSLGATQTISTSQHTAGGSAYQGLRIEVLPINSTQAEATPYLNGVQMLDANNKPIKHVFTFTSATEMQLFAGVKNGFTNLETLNVDSLGGWQLR